MDLAFLIYGISVLNRLNPIVIALFIAMSVYLTIILSVKIVTNACDEPEKAPDIRKWVLNRYFIVPYATFTILFISLPSELTAYTAIGALSTQKSFQELRATEMGEKVLKIINQKLDEVIEKQRKK